MGRLPFQAARDSGVSPFCKTETETDKQTDSYCTMDMAAYNIYGHYFERNPNTIPYRKHIGKWTKMALDTTRSVC